MSARHAAPPATRHTRASKSALTTALRGQWRTWTVAVVTFFAVLAMTVTGVARSLAPEASAVTTSVAVVTTPACFGAAAMAVHPVGCPNPRLSGILRPAPAAAAADGLNPSACWSGAPSPTLHVCFVGPATGYTRRLLAVGDSHNNALLPAYVQMAHRYHWRIDIAGHNSCYWTAALQVKATTDLTSACAAWDAALSHYIATHGGYDAILTTFSFMRSSVAATPGSTVSDATVRGLRAAWAPVAKRGIPVVAIRDVPRMRGDVVACVARWGLRAATSCALPRAVSLSDVNFMAPAVARTPGAVLVDLTRYFCDRSVCRPVIGHVLAYKDHDHITGTFSATLGPYLGQAVATALAR